MITLSNQNLTSFFDKKPRFFDGFSSEKAYFFDLENPEIENLIIEIRCNIILISKYKNLNEVEIEFQFFKHGNLYLPVFMNDEDSEITGSKIQNNKIKILSTHKMIKINSYFDFIFEDFENYQLKNQYEVLLKNMLHVT